MPNGNSPQMQIPLMAENDTLKYLLNNDGFNAMDDGFNRILDVNLSAGNATLTQTQFTRNVTFRCQSHVVPRTLTLPSTVGSGPTVTVNRFCVVINEGTGDVTVSGGAGTNQVVGVGSAAIVITDGTDVYLGSRFLAAREYREEGVGVITDPTFVDFIGNGVTAALSTTGVTVTVAMPTVQDEGSTEVTDMTNINFVGAGVSVTPTGSSAAINIPGVNVEEEGVVQTTGASAVNFIGTGVTAVNNAGVADVTITNEPHAPVQDATTARVAANADFSGVRTIYFTNAAAATYTINTGITAVGAVVVVQDTAAGQVTITAGAGVTLKAADGLLSTRVQYSHVVITPDQNTANHYYVSGDTV